MDPVHRIQTKFGLDILIDPRNIFLKIQDGRQRSKICVALYFCDSYKLTGQLYTSLKKRPNLDHFTLSML